MGPEKTAGRVEKERNQEKVGGLEREGDIQGGQGGSERLSRATVGPALAFTLALASGHLNVKVSLLQLTETACLVLSSVIRDRRAMP